MYLTTRKTNEPMVVPATALTGSQTRGVSSMLEDAPSSFPAVLVPGLSGAGCPKCPEMGTPGTDLRLRA